MLVFVLCIFDFVVYSFERNVTHYIYKLYIYIKMKIRQKRPIEFQRKTTMTRLVPCRFTFLASDKSNFLLFQICIFISYFPSFHVFLKRNSTDSIRFSAIDLIRVREVYRLMTKDQNKLNKPISSLSYLTNFKTSLLNTSR